MDDKPTGLGRPPGEDALVKPMHLRLTTASEAHINQMARLWGIGRQDAVRRIVTKHMRAALLERGNPT